MIRIMVFLFLLINLHFIVNKKVIKKSFFCRPLKTDVKTKNSIIKLNGRHIWVDRHLKVMTLTIRRLIHEHANQINQSN
jgi:hypothetical protein